LIVIRYLVDSVAGLSKNQQMNSAIKLVYDFKLVGARGLQPVNFIKS